MSKDGCGDYGGMVLKPNGTGLDSSARWLGDDQGMAVAGTANLPSAQAGRDEPVEAAGLSCQLTLQLAFFFDGTGNNRDADEPTLKNSNVARLFRAHPRNDEANGIYAFYVPGIGTYFPDIRDAGGSAMGLGAGKGGDDRLDWAMTQLKQVIAKHPPSKLVDIRISAFGFSRGAAAARAFTNRVEEQCEGSGSSWRWKQGDVPLHFYFLGLFDTVASVGLVHTASLIDSGYVATGKMPLDNALAGRRAGADGFDTGIQGLAFGEPGADPGAHAVADGHMSWGGDMNIPALVQKCVHFVAVHEQRNSFPSDSVRDGNTYPNGCEEYVYPGMHSDVGGGYRPGEQGRSVKRQNILAQMPLLHMHALAIAHGVPLYGIEELPSQQYKDYFQVTDELKERWNHYMQTAGRGGKPLGQMILAHTRYWYAWRFHRIHHYLKAINGQPGDTLPNEGVIREQEAGFDRDRAAAQTRVDQLENSPERQAALRQQREAQSRLTNAQMRQSRFGGSIQPQQVAAAQADDLVNQFDNRINQARATLDAIPGRGTIRSIRDYDLNLMKDIQELRRWVKQKGSKDLRPHYRMLLETYENEFIRDSGLKDAEIIAFFNEYVHDSLAGFAKDVTLPSDPRVVYMGGDNEIRYAMIMPTADQKETEAA